MKKNMKTVTVTRVGHPLPHPTTPGLAPEITVQVFFNQESVTLPSSPLSMLIRTGDTLTFEPDGTSGKSIISPPACLTSICSALKEKLTVCRILYGCQPPTANRNCALLLPPAN